jgi:hypothetical protein
MWMEKKTVSEHSGIYADQLKDLFEKETGLYTSLGGKNHPSSPAKGEKMTPKQLAQELHWDAEDNNPLSRYNVRRHKRSKWEPFG